MAADGEDYGGWLTHDDRGGVFIRILGAGSKIFPAPPGCLWGDSLSNDFHTRKRAGRAAIECLVKWLDPLSVSIPTMNATEIIVRN